VVEGVQHCAILDRSSEGPGAVDEHFRRRRLRPGVESLDHSSDSRTIIRSSLQDRAAHQLIMRIGAVNDLVRFGALGSQQVELGPYASDRVAPSLVTLSMDSGDRARPDTVSPLATRISVRRRASMPEAPVTKTCMSNGLLATRVPVLFFRGKIAGTKLPYNLPA